jgi:ABC-type sugar transport system permease subunit
LTTQIYPFLYGVLMSVTNYNLLKPKGIQFVGLQNFVKIFTADKNFSATLGFTFTYALSIVFFSYIVGLFTATLLNKNLRGRAVYRAVILLPWVIAPMVMATNWLWLLNDQFGLINRVLLQAGIIREPILFLATKGMAKASVILVGTWKNIPFMTITLLAGMQSINADLYEAARIDGAGGAKAFWHITLPLIRPVAVVSTTLLLIWAFNGFENVYLLTEGGPSSATMLMSIYAYNTAFLRSQMGYASALSVVMLGFMMALSLIYQRMNRNLT